MILSTDSLPLLDVLDLASIEVLFWLLRSGQPCNIKRGGHTGTQGGTQARQAREAQASISSTDSYLECLLAGGRMDWLNTGAAAATMPAGAATGSMGLVVGFYRHGTRARPCASLLACVSGSPVCARARKGSL